MSYFLVLVLASMYRNSNLYLTDNEQLPPMLLDLLDEANIDIFYSGCIISEIRDYRRSLDSSYESKYILLKPTNQVCFA